MTIKDLINHIPLEILQRGQNYFKSGNILELNQDSNGNWFAEVEGNYGNYEVDIETDNNRNVSNYYCDCPYDGAICTLTLRSNSPWAQTFTYFPRSWGIKVLKTRKSMPKLWIQGKKRPLRRFQS